MKGVWKRTLATGTGGGGETILQALVPYVCIIVWMYVWMYALCVRSTAAARCGVGTDCAFLLMASGARRVASAAVLMLIARLGQGELMVVVVGSGTR